MQVIDGNHFCLDTPEPVGIGTAERCLRGWFLPAQDHTDVRLAVIVDGIRQSVLTGLARPDVAQHSNRPAQQNCGFIARFRVPLVDPIVKVVVETLTGDVVLASIVIDWKPKSHAVSPHELGHVANYREWLASWEPTLFWPESEASQRIAALSYQPLISVILPTYNTDPYFLQRCITSVREQRYSNWQLCVADDCSTDNGIVEYIERVSAEDSRIHFTRRAKQGNISAASNSALEHSQGEFIAFLDHDDELHPFALLEVVRYLNLHESAQLIYSDEDKIDAVGVRSQPAFKPDFDLDMFLSFNYLGHLVALRRSVVTKIGGFRSECDGAQDWDLLIRAVEEIGSSRVHHIPKPLYHWRMHEGSTALNLDAKPYVRRAWSKVLSDRIARTNTEAVTEPGLFYGSMRLRRSTSAEAGIAVVLRAEDGLQLGTLLGSADRRQTRFYRLVGCVLHRLQLEAPIASLADPVEEGSGICSRFSGPSEDLASVRSITELSEEVFIFVNVPLEKVNHGFFDELAAQASRTDVGLVTGISVNLNGRVEHAGFIRNLDGEMIDAFAGLTFPQHAYMGQLNVIRQVEGISHGFFAVRREHLAVVGGVAALSAAHVPRLVSRLLTNARKLGLKVIVTPYAVATVANDGQPLPIEGQSVDTSPAVSMNPNLSRFGRLDEVMRGNF
jgi:O-antigen biosynthesis protein